VSGRWRIVDCRILIVELKTAAKNQACQQQSRFSKEISRGPSSSDRQAGCLRNAAEDLSILLVVFRETAWHEENLREPAQLGRLSSARRQASAPAAGNQQPGSKAAPGMHELAPVGDNGAVGLLDGNGVTTDFDRHVA